MQTEEKEKHLFQRPIAFRLFQRQRGFNNDYLLDEPWLIYISQSHWVYFVIFIFIPPLCDTGEPEVTHDALQTVSLMAYMMAFICIS